MADISMCNNKNCKIKDCCYRHTATPNKYWQSYMLVENKVEKKEDCEHFWQYRRKKYEHR